MAKKKSGYKRMKKIEPAEMDLLFRLPNLVTGAERLTIDLSQCASLVNRRFYRQGINWAVSGFTLHTGGTNLGTVQIQKLPSTWVMSNSWEKGFRVWQRMNNESIAETESVRPRFLDFKIFANDAHHAAGFAANLLPFVYDSVGLPATANPGEWESSKIVIPLAVGGTEGVTASSELVAVGPSWPGAGFSGLDAVSLVEGYASSRALPNIADPNLPDDLDNVTGTAPQNWMSAVFNDGTSQDRAVLDDMQTENNIAPYPFENDGANFDTMYPGGANQLGSLVFHDRMSSTGTTISGKVSGKGGTFPCGLIQLNYNAEMAQSVLQVHLVPGDHRGYLCEPMTDM